MLVKFLNLSPEAMLLSSAYDRVRTCKVEAKQRIIGGKNQRDDIEATQPL